MGHPPATLLPSSQILSSEASQAADALPHGAQPSPASSDARLPASELSDPGCGKGRDSSCQEWSSDISPEVPQVPICQRAGRHQAGASPNNWRRVVPTEPSGLCPRCGWALQTASGGGALLVPWLLMNNFNFLHKQLIKLISPSL